MSPPAPLPPPLPSTNNALVKEWLAKAIGDFAVAQREQALGSQGSADAACYHAQQAIEKIMKALLIHAGTVPELTHDLVRLDSAVQEVRPGWKWPIAELRALSLGAVAYRYPGTTAHDQDAQNSVDVMRRMWAALVMQF